MYTYTVDGGWSDWEYGPCSKTCGGGTLSLFRLCNNPKPSCGGKNCSGFSTFPFKMPCKNVCCPGKKLTILLCMLTKYVCM